MPECSECFSCSPGAAMACCGFHVCSDCAPRCVHCDTPRCPRCTTKACCLQCDLPGCDAWETINNPVEPCPECGKNTCLACAERITVASEDGWCCVHAYATRPARACEECDCEIPPGEGEGNENACSDCKTSGLCENCVFSCYGCYMPFCYTCVVEYEGFAFCYECYREQRDATRPGKRRFSAVE
jgi:hypothetical protein